METLVLENLYKIVVPIFGAAYAAPNKVKTLLYWFWSLSTVLSPTENSRIQTLFKADLIFKDFSRKPSKYMYFLSLWEPWLNDFSSSIILIFSLLPIIIIISVLVCCIIHSVTLVWRFLLHCPTYHPRTLFSARCWLFTILCLILSFSVSAATPSWSPVTTVPGATSFSAVFAISWSTSPSLLSLLLLRWGSW